MKRLAFAGLGLAIVTLVVAVAATGYWLTNKPPKFLFDDIDAEIAPLFAETSPDRAEKLVILYVHGISCHSTDYSAPFQFRLAQRLGFTRTTAAPDSDAQVIELLERGLDDSEWTSRTEPEYLTDPLPPQTSRGLSPTALVDTFRDAYRADAEDKPTDFKTCPSDWDDYQDYRSRRDDFPARILVRRFERANAEADANDELIFVEAHWSPISQRTVTALLEGDTFAGAGDPAPEIIASRAFVNNAAKTDLLNQKISDAVFYLGPGGEAVREVVQTGLCAMVFEADAGPDRATGAERRHPCLEIAEDIEPTRALGTVRDDEAARTTRFAVISESLGSRIVFDTFLDPLPNRLNDTLFTEARSPQLRELVGPRPCDASIDTPGGWARQEALCFGAGVVSARLSAFTSDLRFYMFANQLPLLAVAIDQDTPELPRIANLAALPRDALSDAEDLEALRDDVGRLVGIDRIRGLTGPREAREALEQCVAGVVAPDAARARLLESHQSAEDSLSSLWERVSAVDVDAWSQPPLDFRTLQPILSGVTELDLRSQRAQPGWGCTRLEEMLRDSWDDDAAANPSDLAAIAYLRELSDKTDYYEPLVWQGLFLRFRLNMVMSNVNDLTGCATTDCDQEFVEQKLQRIERFLTDEAVDVVAFSDRNDILSYEVIGRFREQYENSFNFIDVPARLEHAVVPVRGPQGLFVDPGDAHLAHKFSDIVQELMVCGVRDGEATFEAAMDRCREEQPRTDGMPHLKW